MEKELDKVIKEIEENIKLLDKQIDKQFNNTNEKLDKLIQQL